MSQPFLQGKLQGLTSKSKVHSRNQNVSPMPYKNHWTPHSCDEEKQGRLQSQHNFLPFSRKKWPTRRFCPFAAHRLSSAVKETSGGITAWRYFFPLLAITTSCPVSALPEKYWCRGVFCRGVWGSDQRSPADRIALLTLDISDWCRMWPWKPTGVVVLLILLATMSGRLFSVVKKPALLQYKSFSMHTVKTLLNNSIMIR